MKSVYIKRLNSESEVIQALELSLRVFTDCNTADYNEEGYHYFKRFIEDKTEVSQLLMYGAFIGKQLLGVISFKEEGKHLSLFFVDKDYRNLKIGKKLFNFALQDLEAAHILVRSSTFVVEVYKHLGFKVIEKQRTKNGLTSILMEYNIYKLNKEI